MAVFCPLQLTSAGEVVLGIHDVAEGVAAGSIAAACGATPLPNTYCRVLQGPGEYDFAGCCGASTQIIVMPGLRDSLNLTVSYAPTSVADCKLKCALDKSCIVASPFMNEGNLFCNLWAASPCVHARLVCSGCEPSAPYVSLGSWLFPCHGVKVDQTGTCADPHAGEDHGHNMNNHLSHDALMSLSPSPNVRPQLDSNYQYLSGGIGILVYDGVNAMDVLGPFQVLSSAGLMPMLVSVSRDQNNQYKNMIITNSGLILTTDRTLANTPRLDVLVVTGGALETVMVAADPQVIQWIQSVHQNTYWTSSVCTGAWVLGAAGLLRGKRATANWYRAQDILTHFEAIPVPEERYVFDGKIVTAAGVTAGMDMALAMVQKLFSHDLNDGRDFTQLVMLDLQYDPKPPVVGGSPSKTNPGVFEGMQMMYDMIPSYYLNLNMTFAEYVIQTIPI